MGLVIKYNPGETPLDDDELNALKIPSISNRQDLDEFEQKNIEDALLWIKKKKPSMDDILSVEFIKQFVTGMIYISKFFHFVS